MVTSFSYGIMFRASEVCQFRPSRGLRQGDPLSPYLFLLCTEGLTALINQAAAEGRITGVKICDEAPVVTHLFCADDSIAFCNATVEEAEVMSEILSKYEQCSGQKVNLEKSEVYFSPTCN